MSDTAPTPDPTAERNRQINKRIFITLGYLVVLTLGGAIGVAASGSESTSAEPEVVTETETVTDEIEVTPQSCLDALDASERLALDVTVPIMNDMWPEAIDAASTGDVLAMEEVIDGMDELTILTETIVAEYNTAATQCRGES